MLDLLGVIIGKESATYYFNFLSIGALIIVIFSFFVGVFLLTLRNKSRATLYMGLGFINFVPFNFGYLIAQVYYHPMAAYHRWFTVIFVLIALVFFTQFLFHFPFNINRKFSRIFMVVQSLLSLIGIVYFCVSSLATEKVYYFTGHYWDFNARVPSLVIAGYIAAFTLAFVAVGVWKIIKLNAKDRGPVLAMVIGLLIVAGVPSVTNILSRDGIMDRGFHQTLTVLLFVLGLFVVIIFYINSTKDSTTFMMKIVGITLVTMLLVIQGLSVIAIDARETGYDKLRFEEVSRAIETNKFKKEMVYAVHYNLGDRKKQVAPDPDHAPPVPVDFSIYRGEFYNTAFLQQAMEMDLKNYRQNLQELLENSKEDFKSRKDPEKIDEFLGYRTAISEFLKRTPDISGEVLQKALLEYIAELNHKNHILQNKIYKMTGDDLALQLLNLANNTKDLDFAPFRTLITNRVTQYQEAETGAGENPPANDTQENEDEGENTDSSSMSDIELLKADVMNYLAPVNKSGTRLYRRSQDKRSHFVAFSYYDSVKNVVHEIGYKYRNYRKYIHNDAWLLKVLLLVIVFIVLILFPLFFRGALVNPLTYLLEGVTKVNAGDLTVKVPVKVKDEIGFLAGSFNDMVASISEAREQLQDYANNLEEKVNDRTAELNKTLEQVQALKVQQDGDYFLTSLLAKPLNYNANKSKTVSTDFVLKQKKQFEFRQKASDLGGDLCVTGNLRIGKPDNYRRYVVAVNGDAMGKSMQGAGGSLVMGVVMNSILARSAKGDRIIDTTPEQWVADVYEELHGVFLAFNGSMVISAVIAVIDEETGDMWYFNAEHPFQVIMRNGKAAFIEEELLLRKIGLESEFPFKVQRFQLEAGDVVILGSDGRDDIDLTPDEPIRTINDDEFVFLHRVEEANGDIELITSTLLETRGLTDDLSLLRIGFKEMVERSKDNIFEDNRERHIIDIDLETEILDKISSTQSEESIEEALDDVPVSQGVAEGDEEFNRLFKQGRELAREGAHREALDLLNQAYSLQKDVPALNKILAVLTFKIQDYPKAAEILDSYLAHNPEVVDFWLYLSIANKRIGQFEKALQAANKVYELNPNRVPNLIQLADLHQKQGNQDEARKFIEQALRQDPGNQQALALQAGLMQT